MHCQVTYAAGVATSRKTPQRTVGVDNELWADCHAVARARRQRVSDILRAALVAYRDENQSLLDEINASADTDD